jgi:uncharacterized protein YbbK (DUF523 family)
MPRPILISACLIGLQTRYDGQSKLNQKVLDYLNDNDLLPIPVCPEQLGGLATPRPLVRFSSGNGNDVLNGGGTLASIFGSNMNSAFLTGAAETLKIARLTGCTEALFKERSPSCGVHQVYLGEQVVAGRGVTSALLVREGLTVRSEEEL